MGEAGGTFTRSDTFRYYADTNLGGSLNLNQPITASGLFNCTAANTPDFVNGRLHRALRISIRQLCHRHLLQQRRIRFLQAGLGDQRPRRWQQHHDDADHHRREHCQNLELFLEPDRRGQRPGRTLRDAFGSKAAGPRLSTFLRGTQVRTDASFDSFGLMGTNINNTPSASDFADIYIDNVTYTIVPEPVLILPLLVVILFIQRII